MRGTRRPQARGPLAPGLRSELADFLRFVRRPCLAPRFRRAPMPALAADWLGGIQFGRMVRWILLLWMVNFLVFGPLAAGAAHQAGAEHRFDPIVLPWLLALVWAPIIEELMFRLGMRRPGATLWLLPSFLLVAAFGRDWMVVSVLALSLLFVLLPRPRLGGKGPLGLGGADWQPLLPGVRWSWRWNRRYVLAFPWVFHSLTAGFAWLHLLNFSLNAVPWWFWPLLILPQWATGLALGWLRVRGGMGLAMLVHAGFNAGPLLLLWALTRLGPWGL